MDDTSVRGGMQIQKKTARFRKYRQGSRACLDWLERRILLSSYLIPVTNHSDLIYDSVRNQLDIPGSDGQLRRFDVTSKQLLPAITVGGSLRDGDITADGSALFVTDSNSGIIHSVDLQTGAPHDITYVQGSGETNSWDLIVVDGGRAWFDAHNPGPGGVMLHVLNVSTSTDLGWLSSIRSDTPLIRSFDRKSVLTLEYGGNASVWNIGSGQQASNLNNNYAEVAALSRNGQYIVMGGGVTGSLTIRDRSFTVLKDGLKVGFVVFNPVRDEFYLLPSNSNLVEVWDIATLRIKAYLEVGEAMSGDRGIATVSNDGKYLFVPTTQGIRMVDVPDYELPVPEFSTSSYGLPFGQALTLTASVPGGAPAGSIRFYDGSTLLATVPLTAGKASYTTSTLQMGPHKLTANFFDGSTSRGAPSVIATVLVTSASVPANLIPVVDHQEMIYDGTRNQVLIATSDGTIFRYDITSRQFLPALLVNGSPGLGDITADGKYLYLTERVATSNFGTVHKINLQSGEVKDLNYGRGPSEGTAWDLAIGSNGWALFDSIGYNVAPTHLINLDTDSISIGPISLLASQTMLDRSADRKTILISSPDNLGHTLLVDEVQNSVLTGPFVGVEPNGNVSAVSRDGQLFAFGAGSTKIFDRALTLKTTLPAGAVEFSPVGNFFYLIPYGTATVQVYDTETFTMQRTYTLGEAVNTTGLQGMLTFSPDGSMLFVTTPTGVRWIHVDEGTATAAKIAFIDQPANAMNGSVQNLKVSLLDAYGFPIGNASGAVLLSIASGPPGAVLGGTTSVVPTNGIATFSNVSLSLPGTYTLQASMGGVIVASAPFTISNGMEVLDKLAEVGGNFPGSPVLIDGDGNLWGTTEDGGAGARGIVYRIDATNHAITKFADFQGTGGSLPTGPLVADKFGTIWGITMDGMLFKIVKGSNTIAPVTALTGNQSIFVTGGLTIDNAGNLYGVTQMGGTNDLGTIFELPAGSTSILTLASFNGANGDTPSGRLTIDANGTLYGTTFRGGTNSLGVVFKLPKGSSTITPIASFNGANGANPVSGVTLDAAGNIFGTTGEEGANGHGTVYQISKATGTLTTIVNFDGLNGAHPTGDLTIDSAGVIFGTTQSGGNTDQQGSLFRIANGTFTNLQTFAMYSPDGFAPNVALVLDRNGTLYGVMAYTGHELTGGSVFKVDGLATSYHLEFSQVLANATANQVLDPLMLTLKDQLGNVITTYTGNVTLAVASGPGGLSGTTTMQMVNGVATFATLRFNKTGNYALLASGGFGIFSTTSEIINVQSAIKNLVFTQQPADGTAGNTFTVKVTAQDKDGNTVTGESLGLTLTVASGPAPLTGAATVNTVNGVATFQGLSLSKAGAYSLSVTDNAQLSATSVTFQMVQLALAPDKPVNASPANNSVNWTVAPTLLASAFVDGNSDVQLAAQWLVKKVSDGSTVIDSGTDLTHLTSYPVPAGTLANSTQYSWQVRYQDTTGLWSSYSGPTTFTTAAPAIPLGKLEKVTRQEILGWGFDADAGANSVMVRLEIDGIAGASFAADLVRDDLTSNPAIGSPNHGFKIVPGSLSALAHAVKLYVQNAPGTSYVLGASTTIPATAPGAPAELKATALSSNSIKFTWKLADSFENGVYVKRWDGKTWVTIATLPAGTTSYSDTNLTPNTTYLYDVVAVNAAGSTWAANFVSAKTQAVAAVPPAAPTDITALALDYASIKLSWTLHGGETSLYLKRWTGTTWIDVIKLPAGTTSYTVTGLAPSTQYTYDIVAVNAYGGTWGAYTSATTFPKAAPPAATNLAFTQLSPTSGKISWQLHGNETTIYLAKWNGTTWQTIALLPAGTISFTDPGLWIGATFHYEVITANPFGQTWAASYITSKLV